MDMKACKECGKLFVPKSKNSVYCDAIHYRPCPVCGKPVEAKYLSDPARCCSNECKAIARKQSKEKAKTTVQVKKIWTDNKSTESSSSNTLNVVNNSTNNVSTASDESETVSKILVPWRGRKTYVGKPVLHLIPGHMYEVLIDKGEYVYTVECTYDVTDDVEVDIMMPLASQISIHQNFV